MQEIQALNNVREFHMLFKHKVGNQPEFPDDKTCELRIALLQEELNEFKEALAKKDLLEVADALMDIQYVLSGAIISFGLQHVAAEMFEEVHRSNMSKLCKTKQEVLDTIDFYRNQKGYDCFYEEVFVGDEQFFHVMRLSDLKTLKSINYSPANIEQFLTK